MQKANESRPRVRRGGVPKGGNALRERSGPNVYTDPSLLNVAGALEALPQFFLGDANSDRQAKG